MVSKPASLRKLQLLGEVIRVGEKNVLVKSYTIPKLVAKAFNNKGKEVGYVSNIFGPVSTPFVTVKVTSPTTIKEGDPLYTEKT